MKTNIIHILIIAIILIAGWSLFTVLQDLYNVDSNKYDTYSMIGKGKQYLPLTPDVNSSQRKYPVYRPAQYQHLSVIRNPQSTTITKSVVENDAYSISQTNYIDVENSGVDPTLVNPSRRGQTSRSISMGLSKISKPFSKDLKINTERNIADASVSENTTGSTLSEGNGMMRVFGGDDEGDDIEGGGGIENDSFYNDVPVGDGIYLLIFMAMLYAIFKAYRNRRPKSVKIT